MPSVAAHLHRDVLANVQILAVKTTFFLLVENLGNRPAATTAQSPLLVAGAFRPNSVTQNADLLVLQGRVLVWDLLI